MSSHDIQLPCDNAAKSALSTLFAPFYDIGIYKCILYQYTYKYTHTHTHIYIYIYVKYCIAITSRNNAEWYVAEPNSPTQNN